MLIEYFSTAKAEGFSKCPRFVDLCKSWPSFSLKFWDFVFILYVVFPSKKYLWNIILWWKMSHHISASKNFCTSLMFVFNLFHMPIKVYMILAFLAAVSSSRSDDVTRFWVFEARCFKSFKSYKGVLWASQRCLSVSRMFQWSFIGVSRVFQGCFMCV